MANTAAHLPRGKARAHSAFVRVLRWVLPAITVGVVALLIGLVVAHSLRRQSVDHRTALAPIEMINPHFYGRDAQGRAYTLAAREAARDERAFQRVLLSFPTITLFTEPAHASTLTADKGVYHEDTRLLYLQGHVLADNAKSSRFATDRAVVDTRTGAVTSPSALASDTPMGQLQSRSFDVFDKGDTVVFKGGVHARLNAR